MDLSESDLRVSGCGWQEGPLRCETVGKLSGALTLTLPEAEPGAFALER